MKSLTNSFIYCIKSNNVKQKVAKTILASTLFTILGAHMAHAAAPINTLNITIQTGSDDLRGGAVSNAQLRLSNGSIEPMINLNSGAQWSNYTTHTKAYRLSRAYSAAELNNAQIIISHDGAGRNFGESYDNWNVQRISVSTPPICSGGESLLAGSLVKRFTGKDTSALVRFNVPTDAAGETPNRLILTVKTGGDDLRSGAIAMAQIRLRGGRILPNVNLNNGVAWPNNSVRSVPLPLPAGVRLNQLESIVITHDGAGRKFGETYDNWNVNGITVASPRSCNSMNLGSATGSPWKRFTGSMTFAGIPLHTR